MVARSRCWSPRWLLSFLGAVVAFSGFEVERVGDRLRIRRGLLQRRAVSVPAARVDGVQVVESPLRRPFGLVTLRLEVTSLGRARGRGAHALPARAPRAEVEPLLSRFLPELAGPLGVDERPPARARRRYATWPVAAAVAVAAATVALAPAAWPAAPALLALAVLSGLDAYAAAGLRLRPGDARVVVRGRRHGSRVTLVARRRRLQELGVSRTPLQRRAGLATVSIAVARGTRLASATWSARSQRASWRSDSSPPPRAAARGGPRRRRAPCRPPSGSSTTQPALAVDAGGRAAPARPA